MGKDDIGPLLGLAAAALHGALQDSQLNEVSKCFEALGKVVFPNVYWIKV